MSRTCRAIQFQNLHHMYSNSNHKTQPKKNSVMVCLVLTKYSNDAERKTDNRNVYVLKMRSKFEHLIDFQYHDDICRSMQMISVWNTNALRNIEHTHGFSR